MLPRIVAILALVTIAAQASGAAQLGGQALSVRRLMPAAQFRAAGLDKLTNAEHSVLDQWLADYTAAVMSVGSRGAPSAAARRSGEYLVEVSHNDELFIINGERFEAKTYCFNVNTGDPVIFTEGSATGACASAEFYNLRTKQKCAVWCE